MKAQEAFDDALSLFTKAKNMEMSSIDVASLMGNASQIKQQVGLVPLNFT